MPRISVSVINARVVARGIQNLRLKTPKILDSNIKNALEKIAKKARKYPRERPGQTYVRTFTLQRAVKVSTAGKGSHQISIDPVQRGVHYGKYVVGSAKGTDQAWMHKGRWYLFSELTESVLTSLPKTIDSHLKRVTKESNL